MQSHVKYVNQFQVKQKQYEIVQLLSDVGGILGLWAGISVITLMETTLFLLQLCKT